MGEAADAIYIKHKDYTISSIKPTHCIVCNNELSLNEDYICKNCSSIILKYKNINKHSGWKNRKYNHYNYKIKWSM